MIRGLFDDHYQALPLWREAGLRDLTCLHVDAHLDVMEDGFTPQALAGIAAARTGEELERFHGDPELPWGGLHCGNYLYPALLDGTVSTLIWLLPRAVIRSSSLLDGVRQEVARGVDLSFAEYASFRLVGDHVEGTLLGRRLLVCTSDSLPALRPEERANLALDIDIDYFVRLQDDRIWQTPHQLHQALGDLSPVALTVATSCEGGYTPVQHRYLGQVCLDVFSGQPQRWRSELEAMVEAEETREWEPLLQTCPPEWRPAVLSLLGRHEEARRLAPDYQRHPLNLAARCLQKGELEQGLRLLEGCDEPEAARRLLGALAAGDDPALVAVRLELLKAASGISSLERGRLSRAQGEALLRAGDARSAVPLLKAAVRAEPSSSYNHFCLARALRGAGELNGAARSLRTALKFANGRLSSLPMLLEACSLYQDLGQPALARAAARELEASDPTGRFLAELLLRSRRERRGPVAQ